MRIAVLGTGNVGGTLGKRWAQCGHQVVFGSRHPGSEKVQMLLAEAGQTACVGNCQEAVDASDIVLLATPLNTVQGTLASLTGLAGKVLIDCINPLNETFSGLTHGHTQSAAELACAWAVYPARHCSSRVTCITKPSTQWPATVSSSQASVSIWRP